MIQLPYSVQSRLQAAHLTPALLTLVQQECDQRGYLLHPTAIEGSGGFGIVFQAEDATGETKAIKVGVPRPGMEALFQDMCEEEGRKACALADLPHIAAGERYWFSSQAPLFFLVSAYIHGSDLKVYQQRGGGVIAEERLRAWTAQLLEALAAMHEQGLVHRDIKPENILLERASDQVYITDLGVAKYARLGTLEALRTTGTLPYAPVEQIQGHATYKSDQYALGIVLFELATGIGALPPIPARQFGYPVARPAQLEPRHYTPALSPGFAAIIERLATLEPANRFPSMQAAQEALSRLRQVPARQRTQPMEPPTAPLKSCAPMVRESVPARPAFAWRPFWQLRRVVLGGPIHLGGPALSSGGVVWLMLLYLLWLLTTGWGVARTWVALSGHSLEPTWMLAGTVAIVLWRIARTWNVRGISRRGSLSVSRRRGLALWCLVLVVVVALGEGALLMGYPALIWTPAWLESIGCWLAWGDLYVSLEIWLN